MYILHLFMWSHQFYVCSFICTLFLRLLKAFHIDFNWYHLASWINITEQWPYRASWLILFYEANEDTLDDKSSLKDLFEK